MRRGAPDCSTALILAVSRLVRRRYEVNSLQRYGHKTRRGRGGLLVPLVRQLDGCKLSFARDRLRCGDCGQLHDRLAVIYFASIRESSSPSSTSAFATTPIFCSVSSGASIHCMSRSSARLMASGLTRAEWILISNRANDDPPPLCGVTVTSPDPPAENADLSLTAANRYCRRCHRPRSSACQ